MARKDFNVTVTDAKGGNVKTYRMADELDALSAAGRAAHRWSKDTGRHDDKIGGVEISA